MLVADRSNHNGRVEANIEEVECETERRHKVSIFERRRQVGNTRHKNCRNIYSEMAGGTGEMSRRIVKTMDEYDRHTRVKIVAVIRRIDRTISTVDVVCQKCSY